MQYEGKLYGKVGRKYFPLEMDSADVDVLKRALADWLDCWDTPDEWMRCRNNAKIALGRSADPTEYTWPDNDQLCSNEQQRLVGEVSE